LFFPNYEFPSKNAQFGGHTGDKSASLKPHKILFSGNLSFILVDIF